MKTRVTSPPADDELVEQLESSDPASSAIGQRDVSPFAEYPRQRRLTQPPVRSRNARRTRLAEWETQIVEKLPEGLMSSLPAAEEIEVALGAGGTR